MTNYTTKFKMFGDGPIAGSVRRLLEFVLGWKKAENGDGYLLVIVDGVNDVNGADLTAYLENACGIIYFKTPFEDQRHPYAFFSHFDNSIIPAITIDLTINGDHSFSVKGIKEYLNKVVTKLPQEKIKIDVRNDKEAVNNRAEDSNKRNKYFFSYEDFITEFMHNLPEKSDSSEALLPYDYLSSILKVPQDLSLNVLLVENEPRSRSVEEGLIAFNCAFKKIKFYLYDGKDEENFKTLKNNLSQMKEGGEIKVKPLSFDKTNGMTINSAKKINFKEFDLILQDIFLREDSLSGIDLARYYRDVAPQAMVFFLTRMDIETLAAYGYDEYVDKVIAKKRLKALMKYFRDSFDSLYGPLLWDVFVKAQERHGTPSLTDKTSLRHLLGNIRSWQKEPKILFHGFALPEMVDHEYRHTAGLWRMTNRILGPFLKQMPAMAMKKEKLEDRVLLSLFIWLHDIGHRGDKHHYKPVEIREHHGSISESMILEQTDALGIGWLRDFCVMNSNESCEGIKKRNKKSGCDGNGICPLRKVGLLCRYHQSSAPLKKDNLVNLILKLKMPSPYCIVGINENREEINDIDSSEQIEKWLKKTDDFGWISTDIRTLDEFKVADLINLAGLSRWLDALHTHSEKVGSILQVKTFLSYLKMKKKYCDDRIKEIDNLLDKTTSGSEAYLGFLGERMELDDYSQVLDMQTIHLWRSSMVRDIYGEWFWANNGRRAYRIVFELFDNARLDENAQKEIEQILPINGKNHDKWSKHVWEEVIESEIKSQMVEHGLPHFEKTFNGIEVYYFFKENGSEDPKNMCEGHESE